jgi:hypothetical protein
LPECQHADGPPQKRNDADGGQHSEAGENRKIRSRRRQEKIAGGRADQSENKHANEHEAAGAGARPLLANRPILLHRRRPPPPIYPIRAERLELRAIHSQSHSFTLSACPGLFNLAGGWAARDCLNLPAIPATFIRLRAAGWTGVL